MGAGSHRPNDCQLTREALLLRYCFAGLYELGRTQE
jgi:hypothetical protein